MLLKKRKIKDNVGTYQLPSESTPKEVLSATAPHEHLQRCCLQCDKIQGHHSEKQNEVQEMTLFHGFMCIQNRVPAHIFKEHLRTVSDMINTTLGIFTSLDLTGTMAYLSKCLFAHREISNFVYS